MDPFTLATQIIAAITPFLIKGAEAFAEEVGKEAFMKTKQFKDHIWKIIKGSKDKDLQQTTTLYEKNPKTFEEPMKRLLAGYLEKHPSLFSELAHELHQDKWGQKNQITISGGKVYGAVAGDNTVINQTIDNRTNQESKVKRRKS